MSTLEPYQQRVVTERDELTVKRDDLADFILNNPIFNSLPVFEQSDLRIQYKIMSMYVDVLNSRISRF